MEIFVALVLLFIIGAIYERRRFPSGTCRSCNGSGKKRSWWDGKSWRSCGRCGGGTAMRWGSN